MSRYLSAPRFPRLYAAASLKPRMYQRADHRCHIRFPRLYAAASLKRRRRVEHASRLDKFSAALCRGLIEAPIRAVSTPSWTSPGFPRLYAAASLKPPWVDTCPTMRYRFSAALCRGLIEAYCIFVTLTVDPKSFPRLYAAASLKHRYQSHTERAARVGFPRLYAAASLKPASWLAAAMLWMVFRGFMPRPH